MPNLILIVLLAVPCWVMSATLDTGNGAGFSLARFSGGLGQAAPVIRATNFLAGYRWETECNELYHVVCYDNQPITPFIISKDVRSAIIRYSVDTGYSSGTVQDRDGKDITFALDSMGYTTVSRGIRLQFKKDITITGNCNAISKVPASPSEISSGYRYVYLIKNNLRWVTCNIEFNNLDGIEDIEAGFSASGTAWRIDRGIFNLLPTGLYEARGSVADAMKLETYSAPDFKNLIKIGNLFTRYAFRVMIMMIGYVEFKITSPASQTLDFDTRVDKVKRFQFNGYIDTNSTNIDLIVRCQWVTDGKCALSNGNEFIPVEIGFKADYSGGAPTTVLQHDIPLSLNRGNGYIITELDTHKSPVSILFSMYSDDVKKLSTTNINRTFSGNMTVIIDAAF